ncbi:hypothetical protein [Acaryochloris sp. IP29b_bin.148]|uniref:hypothetical protein n=1 Tax=Acaryochloris sp. IP29b_bin.148 TaxID=2969218 RepID=UPI00260D1D49|nr:hypothetical protein [Acaryochloris sp. IP29b_bin.148]
MKFRKKKLFKAISNKARIAPYYFLGVISLSLCVSLWMTNEYWGYLLEPPSLLKSAQTITEVNQLIPVRTSDCDTPKQCKFVIDPSQKISAHYDPRDQPPTERLLLYLQDTEKLPASFDRELQEDLELYAPMLKSPIIATPEKGYTNHFLEGVIMIGRTASKQQRAFISARGNQVSNDHYPYYEAIFAIGQNGKTVQYLEGQRFFFDIAGIEGFEGLPMIIFLFIPLVLIFGIMLLAIVVIADIFRNCLPSIRVR